MAGVNVENLGAGIVYPENTGLLQGQFEETNQDFDPTVTNEHQNPYTELDGQLIAQISAGQFGPTAGNVGGAITLAAERGRIQDILDDPDKVYESTLFGRDALVAEQGSQRVVIINGGDDTLPFPMAILQQKVGANAWQHDTA